MTLREQPLLTREMPRDALVLEPGAVYVHGADAAEDRGDLSPGWVAIQAASGALFRSVRELEEEIVLSDGSNETPFYLTDADALSGHLAGIGAPIYLDITSLRHSSWAPLVRAGIESGADLRVVYLEPASYRRSSTPSPGLIFDLSERIGGIAPLPGFARLGVGASRPSVFLPLLGFEGARFSYAMENVEVVEELVFPVVGVPGFRPEYPFDAFAGNRVMLRGDVTSRVQFAKANCPFDLFHTLHRVHRKFTDSNLKVAPIGTKPHALGAVLYALSRPSDVELVYDHPVKSSKRTQGEARLCLYDVGSFARSSLFLRHGEFAPVAA